MSPLRVLILEDDPILSLDLAAIVCCWTDARIVACRSVAQARRALKRGIDFALLDIEVEDGTSFDFATELRDRKLPFAFVSGSALGDMPEELDDVTLVAKPYAPRAIESLVTAAAGGRRHP